MSEKAPLPEQESGDTNQKGYLGPTAPVGQLPPRGERFWVDRREQLLQAVSKLNQSSVIAIDAEFTQVRSRTQSQEGSSSVPRLALLQLAIDRCCFVVDTLRLQDLSPLGEIVANPECITLLHGAGADLRVMAERNLHVAHYYDLEATCRSIFGQHESSLAAMLQRAFHSHLDKSLQRTDWTRRPLPPAMIAYAARDAEVTLALYAWLKHYYEPILQLHENTLQPDAVAPWIEPFLRGTAVSSPELAVAEARAQGIIQKKAQVASDCLDALLAVTHPMRRNRLLRLIADLSLTQTAPDILFLLQASTSDERAGCARTLGRLGIQSAREPLQLLLQDPVQDVRKAAQTALHNLDEKEQKQSKAVDGSRTWVVEDTEPAGTSDDDQSWKARLRSMIDS